MFGRSTRPPLHPRAQAVSLVARGLGVFIWLGPTGWACSLAGQEPEKLAELHPELLPEQLKAVVDEPLSTSVSTAEPPQDPGESTDPELPVCAARIAAHVEGLVAARGNRRGGDPKGAELAERWIELRGRPVPPGLPAERTAVLRAAADSAVEQLIGQPREDLVAGLRHALEDAEISSEAWSRCVHLAGELEFAELVPQLTAALERAPDTFQGGLLRRALYRISGRWVEPGDGTLESFEDLSSSAAAVRASWVVEFKAKALERRNLLRRLWSFDRDLLIESLADESPLVRAEAARELASPAAGAREEPAGSKSTVSEEPSAEEREAQLLALVEAVCEETDLGAACSQILAIGALIEASGRTPAQAPRVLEVLEGFLMKGPPELLHAVTRSTVDWSSGDPVEALNRRSNWVLEALKRLENSRVSVQGPSPVHPDVQVATLDAVRRLARESRTLAAENPAAATGFRRAELVRAIEPLLSGAEVASEVRLAAVSAMRFLAGPGDLGSLQQVFSAYPDDTALQFALVGVFEEVARDAQAPDASGEPGVLTEEQAGVLSSVARELLSAQSLDLRRRAHDLLAAEMELDALDQERVVAALKTETDLPLTIDLIDLLLERVQFEPAALLETPQLAAVFEERPDLLDAWANALGASEARLPLEDLELADRLHALAGEANLPRIASRSLQLALRPETGVSDRLAIAIDGSDPELAPGRHRLLVVWADELAGDPLAASRVESRAALAQMVLEHHLEPARSLFEPEQADRLLARLTVAAGAGYSQLKPALERALESSTMPELREIRLLAARALARCTESEALVEAIEVYGKLEASSFDNLEVRDRRSVFEARLELARRAKAAGDAKETVEQLASYAVTDVTALVRMPGWQEGDPAVAFEDLERFHDAILLSGSEAGLEVLGAKLYEEDPESVEGDGPQPYSVLAAIQRAEELRERLEALQAKIAALENTFAEAPAPPKPDPEPAEDSAPEQGEQQAGTPGDSKL